MQTGGNYFAPVFTSLDVIWASLVRKDGTYTRIVDVYRAL
jgi:hypothetical protein